MKPSTFLHIRISEIRIVGGSSLEARRLADALPTSLNHALAQIREPRPSVEPRAPTFADRAAAQIADVVRSRLEASL